MKIFNKIICFALISFLLVGCGADDLTKQVTETKFKSNSHSFSTELLEQDSLALVALFNSTDGKKWREDGSWLRGDIVDWEGVKVEMFEGQPRVVSLRLGAMNLNGTLPKEIKALTALHTLDVNHNPLLTGPIIDEVFELKNLVTLRMSFTSMVGELSPLVGNLVKLDTLDLWTSPWEQLGGSLDKNPHTLSGKLPKELGKLKNLRFLNLGRHNFTGELPAEMGDMASLDFLDVAECNLTGGIPASFGKLKNLKILFASFNKLNKPIPVELCNAESLEKLFLNGNQIPGNIPQEIGKLKNLESLSLWSNNLTGEIPASIEQLKKLHIIYLQENKLEGEIPVGIGANVFPQLVIADLSNNNLTGSMPVPDSYFMDNYGYYGKRYNRILVKGNKMSGDVPAYYLGFSEVRENFLPQQAGYGFNNLK